MNIENKLSTLYNSLVDAIGLLNDSLLASEVIQAQCYKLPPHAGEHGHNEKWQFVSPDTLTDFTALVSATSVYAQFTANLEHSPKYPYRLPGLIQLPSSEQEPISLLVGRCNLLKEQFKTTLTQSTLNPEQKRSIVQSICTNAITLQIYRLICCPVGPVKHVGFTWCNKNSMRRYDKETFLSYLNNSMDNPPAGLTKADWQPFVEREIELIKQQAGESIRIKRPLPTLPKLNISFLDETKNVMFYGHMPVIVFGDEPAKISPLKQYINETNPKHMQKYLIERLYVI